MLAFAVLALVAVVSALMVVTSRNPVVSALWLALTLASTAGIFLVLGAEFLAVIQLIIYAGAILVFFLFVVMLLNLGKLERAQEEHPIQFWTALFGVPALALVLLFAVGLGSREWAAAAAPEVGSNTREVAAALFSRYLAPFEITSVLLLVAMVGAVVLAKRRF